jgi:hypothetical protein
MDPEFVMTAFIVVGLVITLAVLFGRSRNQQLLHQERMAALEKGVAVVEPRLWSTRVYLLRGLIWSFCGAALCICLFGLSTSNHTSTSVALLGLIPLSVGLAYLVFYFTGERRQAAGGGDGEQG